jgi:hypothetical protein
MSAPSEQGRFELAGFPLWVIVNSDGKVLRARGAFADGGESEYLNVFTDEAQAIEFVEKYLQLSSVQAKPLSKERALSLLDECEAKGIQYAGIDAWAGRGGGVVTISQVRDLIAETP